MNIRFYVLAEVFFQFLKVQNKFSKLILMDILPI